MPHTWPPSNDNFLNLNLDSQRGAKFKNRLWVTGMSSFSDPLLRKVRSFNKDGLLSVGDLGLEMGGGGGRRCRK